MRRREFIGLVGGAAAWPFAAAAQAPERIFRIGYLEARDARQWTEGRAEDFREGLRDLGYIEGKNLRFELRFAEGDESRLPALARELAALRVDVIVTLGSGPIRRAAGDIDDPDRHGLGGRPRRLGTGLQSRPSRRKYHRIDVLHRGTVRQAAGDARGDRSVAGASWPAAAQNQAPRRRGANRPITSRSFEPPRKL